MTQEQEIQEVIKKNLPQHVGETLKQRLEQADKDATEVKTLKAQKEHLEKEIKALQTEIEQYRNFDIRNGLLDLREKEIETEKRDLEVEKLKYQLQSEKDKTTFSQNLAMGLVRNTEYKKTIFDSENSGQPVIDGQGYSHYPLPSVKNHISTEEAK